MHMAGRFCTPSQLCKPLCFSLFRVIQLTSLVISQVLIRTQTLQRPSLVISNMLFPARQFEASKMTIMIWIPMLSCMMETLMWGPSPSVVVPSVKSKSDDFSRGHAFHGGAGAQETCEHGGALTHSLTESIRACRGSALPYASAHRRPIVDGSTYATHRL